MDYLRKAVRYQTTITQQAITGKGLDNHLLALVNTLREVSLPISELFTDNSYKIFNHFELSTSQIPTISRDIYMCYGPVVDDGYGCSYNPQKVKARLESSKVIFMKITRTASFSAFHHSKIVTQPLQSVSG
jgi:hypothetical protein